jgi:hypothetical protein
LFILEIIFLECIINKGGYMFKYLFSILLILLLLLGCTNSKKTTGNSRIEFKEHNNIDSSYGYVSRFYALETDDIEGLLRLNKIEYLTISNNDMLMDLKFFENLSDHKSLEYLGIYNCNNIEDLEPIKYLENLRKVDIHDCDNVKDLEPLNHLQKIEILSIGTSNILDILPKLKNDNLKQLILINTSDKKEYLDLNNLIHLSNLRYLSLYNYDIKDTSPLLKMQYLVSVSFKYTNFDPMPLLNSSSIKRIEYMLYGDENRRKDIPEEIFEEHGIEIIFDPDGK